MKQPEFLMKHQRVLPARLLLLLLLGLLWLAAGCQSDVTVPTSSEAPAATGTVPTQTETDPSELDDGPLPGDRPNQPGGTLRLWQLATDNPNPLLASDQSQLAVNDLIYQGLYRIESDQSLRPQLIREMSNPADETSVVISLQPGSRFHDGTAVTSDDVAACIQFILDHPEQSVYADALARIASIEVENPVRLRLELSAPDPWLAYALVFPVIPADWLNQQNRPLIPGSGAYRMTTVREDGTLELTLDQFSFDSSELRRIDVTPYRDLQDALTAFAGDELDLLLLPEPEYTRYSRRGSLRFSPFAGHDMVLAHLRTGRGSLADYEPAFLKIKEILLSLPIDEMESQVIRREFPLPSAYEVSPGDIPSMPEIIQQLLAENEADWNQDDFSRPLRLIWPEHDPLRHELAELIGIQLDLAGINWEGQPLSADEFNSAWISERYEIALVAARLPLQPDPSWLYLHDGRPEMTGSEPGSAPSSGIAGFDEWLALLETVWHQRSPESRMADREQGLLLHHLSVRSAWQPLLIREQALLAGDRVIGSSRPNVYHPYEGIEELWVWS
ncbi:MAG: ABC transporter substrate-binding protein [Eubacteriales bacterium]|nr:ABC transporter substrate-binding protein [Eubacteriales bacterium]